MIGSPLELLTALTALVAAVLGADSAGGALGDVSLIERWRELGPVLWLIAAGGAMVWVALLCGFALATRCRDVEAGPSTLDLGGPESPAVVILITGEWRLGHEAVPATLLDLAARRMLAIDEMGERTFVRVPSHSVRSKLAARLEPYERLVLDHVVANATNGVTPADALTTGPEEDARGWWTSFRRSVERDAHRRGLSRRRWSPAVRAILLVAAVVVAALVGLAATTLPDDPDDPDDDPAGMALALSVVTAGALTAASEALNGQRDTPAGREAASRWRGLRTLLAEDPLFAEYPPAGVAIWDRLLAYGAAMGVAHGAVGSLPLGAESDEEAWSPLGGHWRVVRIRYPRFVPPGYGRRPGLVAAIGLLQIGFAVPAFPAAAAAADALGELVTDFSDATVPAGVRLGVSVALGVVVALAAVVALRGTLMLISGIADLLSERRRVEGRVLRVRRRGDDEHPRWYVAVDDGMARRVRAWRTTPGGAAQGATVGADVTRWLAHVRNLEVLTPAPARPSLPDDSEEASPMSTVLGMTNVAAGAQGRSWEPLPAVTGDSPSAP